MKNIIEELVSEIETPKEKAKYIVGMIIVDLMLMIIITVCLISLNDYNVIDLSNVGNNTASPEELTNTLGILIFPGLFLYAFIEELMFRFPLAAFNNKRNLQIIMVLIISSFFGWLHGNVYNILIQGTSGVVLSITFLKCGGSSSNSFNKVMIGLMCCTIVHALTNAIIIGISYI